MFSSSSAASLLLQAHFVAQHKIPPGCNVLQHFSQLTSLNFITMNHAFWGGLSPILWNLQKWGGVILKKYLL